MVASVQEIGLGGFLIARLNEPPPHHLEHLQAEDPDHKLHKVAYWLSRHLQPDELFLVGLLVWNSVGLECKERSNRVGLECKSKENRRVWVDREPDIHAYW